MTRRASATTAQWATRGLVAALVLMTVALLVPAVSGWQVHANSFAPLSAHWRPRLGPGTGPAVVLGAAVVWWGPALAERLSWSRLLAVTFGAGTAWLSALALTDGSRGIGGVLGRPDEYLPAARSVTDVPSLLRGFIDRIPLDSNAAWPTHVAGHPPGALLVFVALVGLGAGSGLAAGATVLVVAATTPAAVLITLRRLGAEPAARAAAPLIAIGPAAIWSAVSADAIFAAVSAWGMCALSCAATSPAWRSRLGWSLLAGMVLGYCAFLSYGLALLGVLAAAVLMIARTIRPVPGVVAGAGLVVLAFAAAGFDWWAALPVLRERYYAGLAAVRPAGYWLWADLAALCFSAGPVVGASLAASLERRRLVRGPRNGARAVVVFTLAAAICVLLADASLMSKAEVERIWLPFVPWLLVGVAILPRSWRVRALAGQVVLALVLQSLLVTRW